MRRSQRLIAATMLVALSSALGGCSSGLSNWDPTDLLDFLDTKKKLPGERKPVFPSGVPGLDQGVPKDLYKNNAERQQQEAYELCEAEPLAEHLARDDIAEQQLDEAEGANIDDRLHRHRGEPQARGERTHEPG